MKAMVVVSYSCSQVLTVTCLYRENWVLWGIVLPLWVFGEFYSPIDVPMLRLIRWWETFTELFLSNIGTGDVKWHIGIQGMHLSAFWDYFGKEKEALTKMKLY